MGNWSRWWYEELARRADEARRSYRSCEQQWRDRAREKLKQFREEDVIDVEFEVIEAKVEMVWKK